MNIVLSTTNGVATMSSLEMVAYINATREPGRAELRHDTLLTKVPTVLKDAQNFLGMYKDAYNRDKPCYNFPKREACLMAMSYSYELQAKVFDAWVAAEEKLATKPVVALPNFDDPIEAALAWVEERKASNAAKAQLAIAHTEIEVAKPKVEFHDAVVASEDVYTLLEAAKLIGTGRTKLCNFLRDNKYVQFNLVPYQRCIEAGWLESAFHRHVLPSGQLAAPTTYMTSKGLAYFQAKIALAKKAGSL